MQILQKRNEPCEHTGALPMALRKNSFVQRPLFRRTVLELHGLLRKLKRRWQSQKSDTSVVIGRSKCSWTAPKELKLPKKMQAKRDEWLRLVDYSYKDLI